MQQYIRVVQKAKIRQIFRFRTFLESWDDSKSKLIFTFFSKVGLKGPAFDLKFCIFCITPKENTLFQVFLFRGKVLASYREREILEIKCSLLG